MVPIFLGSDLAAVEGKTENTKVSTQKNAYWVAPFKGPVNAPVEIAVFSDFH